MRGKTPFVSIIEATDPKTGFMRRWVGPVVIANNIDEAQQYCNAHGMGYIKVIPQIPYDLSDESFEITRAMLRSSIKSPLNKN